MSVVLKTNEKIFSGWKSAEIERSIKAMSGQFMISFTDVWNNQMPHWGMKSGDKCEIELNDIKIITGFIDSLEINVNADSRTLTVSGRDITGNLVDSSTSLKIS